MTPHDPPPGSYGVRLWRADLERWEWACVRYISGPLVYVRVGRLHHTETAARKLALQLALLEAET